MANQVQPQDYVANLAHSTRCVDDRADKSGENLGVQFPGHRYTSWIYCC